MNNDPEHAFTRSIQGQLLRSSERREAAIFLRDGRLWVADFIDSQGEIIDAITWFRFNTASLSTSHARRRMVLESATPLSEELVHKIEDLQRPVPRQAGLAKARLSQAMAAYWSRIRVAAMRAWRIGRPRAFSKADRLMGGTSRIIREPREPGA